MKKHQKKHDNAKYAMNTNKRKKICNDHHTNNKRIKTKNPKLDKQEIQ